MIQPKKNNQSGFSLIELVGVLAIMAVLFAAISPNVIGLIKRETSVSEAKTLESLGVALKEYILENNTIPRSSNWHTAIASYTRNGSGSLNTTISGTRRYIIHPNFSIGTFPATTDYVQDDAFSSSTLPSVKPSNAQILLISNIENAVPTTNLTATQFDNIWNQTANVTGFEPGVVQVERVSLIPMFKSIIFNAQTGSATHWNLNKSTTDQLWPTTAGDEFFVFKNSRVITKDGDGGNPIEVFSVSEATTIGEPPTTVVNNSSTVQNSSSGGGISCPSSSRWNSGRLYLASSSERAWYGSMMYESIVDSRNAQPAPGGNTWWAPVGACN